MNSTLTTRPAAVNDVAASAGHKFLTFCLGREEYGVDILAVKEIIGLIDITPLPQTPDYVTGIINLRGRVIPVIDLRRRFALPAVEHTSHTCIIVLEVGEGSGDERYRVGVIVDTVSEVLDIAADQIEPTPNFGCSVNTDFVKAIGKMRDRVITLLEIDSVLATQDVANLRRQMHATEADCRATSGDEPLTAP